MKCSTYYFHLKTKILTSFYICISAPLKDQIKKKLFFFFDMKQQSLLKQIYVFMKDSR